MSRRLRWLIAVPVAALVLIVGGTWFYFHVIEGPAPKKFSLSSGSTATTAADAPAATGPFTLAGSWKPTSSSQVGYRVKLELLIVYHDAERFRPVFGAFSSA